MRSLIDREVDLIVRDADPGDAWVHLWLSAAVSELFESQAFMRSFASAVFAQRRLAHPNLDALDGAARDASPAMLAALGVLRGSSSCCCAPG